MAAPTSLWNPRLIYPVAARGSQSSFRAGKIVGRRSAADSLPPRSGGLLFCVQVPTQGGGDAHRRWWGGKARDPRRGTRLDAVVQRPADRTELPLLVVAALVGGVKQF